MKRLAIDTSSVACTVALCCGERRLERHEERAREHTRILMPMLRELLQVADVELSDLDGIVLGNGPGSFIGMRIAASVAQGLAHGAGLPIFPVSSLAAVAAQVMAETDANQVAVAQDAHMNEVYFGIYRRAANGLPELLGDEYLQAQGAVEGLQALGNGSAVAAGEGWQRYPELLAANAPYLCGQSSVLHPRASYLLDLSLQAEAVRPEDIAPAYLRQKVAEKPSPNKP